MTKYVVTPAEERFWPKIEFHGPIPSHCPELGPCWIWTAHVSKQGYGRFNRGRVGEGITPAHIWAYEYLVEPVPKGMQLDHLCRNRACVRIRHLEVVTPQTNVLRGHTIPAMNASKVLCKNGHPFDPTYYRNAGTRRCRICQAIRNANRYIRTALPSEPSSS